MACRVIPVILASLCAVAALPRSPAADPPAARPGPRPAPLLPPSGGPTVAVAVSADGKWVLTGDYTCNVSLWRVGREAPVWTVRATEDGHGDKPLAVLPYGALAVGFAADGKRVRCAWYAGVAEIDRNTGKVLRSAKLPKPVKYYNHEPHAVTLPSSDECVYSDPDERLVRFDFATGKRHPKFDLRLTGVGPLCVKLSPDGKRVLAYNGGTNYVSEWDLETGELCRSFGELPRAGFQDAGYSGDGSRIWVQRHTPVDGEVRFARDRETGKAAWLPVGLSEYEGRLWFSPDGKHAVGLPWDAKKEDRVDVIRVEDGKVVRSFSSEGVWYHQQNLWRDPKDKGWSAVPGQLAFTADGRSVLLTGGEAKTVMGIWDLATGKRTHTFREE